MNTFVKLCNIVTNFVDDQHPICFHFHKSSRKINERTAQFVFIVPPLTVFSIVKVAIFLTPTGTLRKIMIFLRKITVCSSLMPPLENKLRLKYSMHTRINTTYSCSM